MKPWEKLAFQRGQSYVKQNVVLAYYDCYYDQKLVPYIKETVVKCRRQATKDGHIIHYGTLRDLFLRHFNGCYGIGKDRKVDLAFLS
ncbi:MAG: hypothetical protein IM557_11230 [Chitinophagaceae bacterium]|nr:hypothetical protein [Chitinophagaceae bacterium]